MIVNDKQSHFTHWASRLKERPRKAPFPGTERGLENKQKKKIDLRTGGKNQSHVKSSMRNLQIWRPGGNQAALDFYVGVTPTYL
jgi:hypothetical protein